jgi:hypothetical protein
VTRNSLYFQTSEVSRIAFLAQRLECQAYLRVKSFLELPKSLSGRLLSYLNPAVPAADEHIDTVGNKTQRHQP